MKNEQLPKKSLWWLISDLNTIFDMSQTFPPMTRPAEKSCNFPIFFNTSNVW